MLTMPAIGSPTQSGMRKFWIVSKIPMIQHMISIGTNSRNWRQKKKTSNSMSSPPSAQKQKAYVKALADEAGFPQETLIEPISGHQSDSYPRLSAGAWTR